VPPLRQRGWPTTLASAAASIRSPSLPPSHVDRVSLSRGGPDPPRTFRVVGQRRRDILRRRHRAAAESRLTLSRPRPAARCSGSGNFADATTSSSRSRPGGRHGLTLIKNRAGLLDPPPLFMGSKPIATPLLQLPRPRLRPRPVAESDDEASMAMTLALKPSRDRSAVGHLQSTDELLAPGHLAGGSRRARGPKGSTPTRERARAGRSGPLPAGRCDMAVSTTTCLRLGLSRLQLPRLACSPASQRSRPLVLAANPYSPMSRSLSRQGGAAATLARSAPPGSSGFWRLSAT